MTTAVETRALTVPAPKIEIGDVIDGRVVRSVTGRKPRAESNTLSGAVAPKGHAIDASCYVGHIVCVGFEDGGPFMHFFGTQEVEVERSGGGAATPPRLRTGVSAIKSGMPPTITGWRWIAFTAGGRVERGEELDRQGAIDAAERAARGE